MDGKVGRGQIDLALEDKIMFLQTITLFRKVPVQSLIKLAENLSLKKFLAGDRIITQGEVGETLFIIYSGKVEVDKTLSEGWAIPVAVLEKGCIVGEMAIITNQVRSATVWALEDTFCLCMDQADFHRLAREAPDFVLEVTSIMNERLGS